MASTYGGGGHYSTLDGNSDDVFCLLLKMESCPAVSLQMNYLDRLGRREILINTEEHTYHLDLVKMNIRKIKKQSIRLQ